MQPDITLIIPTFNRKTLLVNVLQQIFNSPLAQAPITVVDNCSTDATSEEIQHLVKTHPNLSHIRNTYNMGMAGNLVKALECAYNSKTKYFWILFDDTKLDFTHWNEVVKYIKQDKPIIVVTNYYQVSVDDLAPIFLMMIYPFAAIYKTRLLTPVTLLQALTDIYTVHPQMAFLCYLFNNHIPLTLTQHIIASPSANPEKEYSFNRVPAFVHFRLSAPSWFVPGFLNAIEALNKPLKRKCIKLLFTHYHGYGPYITKYWVPPYSAWHKTNLMEILSLLPVNYKLKFIKLLIQSSWRNYVQPF